MDKNECERLIAIATANLEAVINYPMEHGTTVGMVRTINSYCREAVAVLEELREVIHDG